MVNQSGPDKYFSHYLHITILKIFISGQYSGSPSKWMFIQMLTVTRKRMGWINIKSISELKTKIITKEIKGKKNCLVLPFVNKFDVYG